VHEKKGEAFPLVGAEQQLAPLPPPPHYFRNDMIRRELGGGGLQTI